MKPIGGLQALLTAKAATGTLNTTGISAINADKIALALDSAGSADLTVKFQGSYANNPPDFTASQSASNQWDYIQVVDLQDGEFIDGDTGVVLSGADDHRQFAVNVEAIKWVNAIVTARSAGSVTVNAQLWSIYNP